MFAFSLAAITTARPLQWLHSGVVHRHRQDRLREADTRSIRRLRQQREPWCSNNSGATYYAARQRQDEVQLNVRDGACGRPDDIRAMSDR
jgi:hypothetical protein